MTIQEEKRLLRKTIREAEVELPDAYWVQASGAICARLAAMPEYLSARTVFCFVGTGREIDTRTFLENALHGGKRLCVPLCIRMGVMELRQIDAMSRLVPGAYGIPEPTRETPLIGTDEVDFAVIPCLSCSHSGLRTVSSRSTAARRYWSARSASFGTPSRWSPMTGASPGC